MSTLIKKAEEFEERHKRNKDALDSKISEMLGLVAASTQRSQDYCENTLSSKVEDRIKGLISEQLRSRNVIEEGISRRTHDLS